MRVVAGTHKGRRLKRPLDRQIRPTSARVREALFSILAERLRNTLVLDLYAGTGALGLEALSRGAKKAVFVENKPSALHVLRDNIERCSKTMESRIVAQDVTTFLLEPFNREPFNLIFADPPYQYRDFEQLLKILDNSGKVATQGLVIIEHFKKVMLPEQVGWLHQVRQSQYGDTVLTIFHKKSPPEEQKCV